MKNNLVFRKEKIGWLVYDQKSEETFLVNNSGKLILDLIIQGFSEDKIITKITEIYNIPKAKTKKNLKKFLIILNSYK